ncbi:hypothetical protein QYE76_054111 [Lolium multiflorum]|uniref:Uncharacterized protein n=1 Tax=Lolium multiflorum TaxID=4521 RepID=A0AAD8SXI5_LOLMU|nr:hypothetical protein QYE76_054111 [Lolium multiflorum]
MFPCPRINEVLPPVASAVVISTTKYMKDIVSNKRKIPNEEISTMLANYSFSGKIPKKLGDPGILDDFFTLVNRAGLATYVGDEREQYCMLTKIFVESFKFHNTQYEPTVAFKIYGNPVTMELEEFCRALDIALILFADGNENEIPLPQPGLFNIDRQSWSLTKEEVEEHMKIQDFHQQHDSEDAEPSYDCTVTYPDVSSSTYLEPGRSSSYTETPLHGDRGNELHLGQKPKLGGGLLERDIFDLFLPEFDKPWIMASPSINFNQFLEKEKLKSNGSNFTDWFRHVRIFLNGGNLQYVLEAPLGPPPPPAVSEEEKNVFENRVIRYSQVQCAILCSLEAELQKRFEHHFPCEMIRELKVIFETHAAMESYEASKQFFGCMMAAPLNMNKELPELFSMLKSAEVEIQKEHQVLMVNKTTSSRSKANLRRALQEGRQESCRAS